MARRKRPETFLILWPVLNEHFHPAIWLPMAAIGCGRPKPVKRPSGATMVPVGFSAAVLRLRSCRVIAAAQTMGQLVMRAAGHRLTSLVRTSTSSPCGSTAVTRPDELNGVGIEIDPRCGHPGKLDGSATPGGPNHLFTRRRRVVQGTGVAGSGPCRCTTNVCGWGGWKVYDYKEKREPLEDRPGWGSLSDEWKI
jgi:hypothetical protein